MSVLGLKSSGVGDPILLFGVRSPLVVEYEDVCAKRGMTIVAGVSLGGAPRLMNPSLTILLENLGEEHLGVPFIACAFSSERRKQLTELAVSRGLRPAPALTAPSADISASARIRSGSLVNAGAVIGAVSIIGMGCLVNRSASVGHHTVIEDFVSIGPGATLASNIRVGEGCLIGAGATLLPNVQVGAGSIIAAGAVVRKSVPPGVMVSGNPGTETRLPPQSAKRHLEDE